MSRGGGFRPPPPGSFRVKIHILLILNWLWRWDPPVERIVTHFSFRIFNEKEKKKKKRKWKDIINDKIFCFTSPAIRLSSRRVIPFCGCLKLNSLHTWSQMLPSDCLLGGLTPFCGKPILNSLHTWSQMLPSDCLLGNWSHSVEGLYWTACIHCHRCCPQIVF